MTREKDMVNRKRQLFAPFLVLMLFWVLLNGSIRSVQ